MTVSPMLVLLARAEARATLYRNFEFDLEDAVAPLRDYALSAGIVDDIGAAAVVAILDSVFGVKRESGVADDIG